MELASFHGYRAQHLWVLSTELASCHGYRA